MPLMARDESLGDIFPSCRNLRYHRCRFHNLPQSFGNFVERFHVVPNKWAASTRKVPVKHLVWVVRVRSRKDPRSRVPTEQQWFQQKNLAYGSRLLCTYTDKRWRTNHHAHAVEQGSSSKSTSPGRYIVSSVLSISFLKIAETENKRYLDSPHEAVQANPHARAPACTSIASSLHSS